MAKKSIVPKQHHKIKINGDIWNIYLFTYTDFVSLWDGCCGITHYEHRHFTKKKKELSINFRGPKVSRDTIVHELMHAYLSYHDFSKVSYGSIEEKICEIMGKKYKVLYTLANKLYTALNR